MTIDEVLTRGVEKIYPNREKFKQVLESGKKLKIYLGIDPTAPTLHLGHVIPLLKLRQFQQLGHKIILLIGGFTARIGDPSGKTEARKVLTKEQVAQNQKGYKKQISRILDSRRTKFENNARWFEKMSSLDFARLTSNFTVAQLLHRDLFKRRLAADQDLFMSEFIYPVLQAYDSVAMDVDVEIGGNDQTFNMLAGRDLAKRMKGKEKFVVTTKLLTDPTGKKMGKTEGNMVAFSDTPDEVYGKVMSWSDEMMPLAFETLTILNQNIDPFEAKKKLAFEVTKLLHGDKRALTAQKSFEKKFQKKDFEGELKEIKAQTRELLRDVLVKNKIVSSNTEFTRLVKAGAIEIIGGEKITDPHIVIQKEIPLRVGKRHFLKIVLKD